MKDLLSSRTVPRPLWKLSFLQNWNLASVAASKWHCHQAALRSLEHGGDVKASLLAMDSSVSTKIDGAVNVASVVSCVKEACLRIKSSSHFSKKCGKKNSVFACMSRILTHVFASLGWKNQRVTGNLCHTASAVSCGVSVHVRARSLRRQVRSSRTR